MMFISYAQNFEDVMLWRALGHVSKGFYIDVGACSPSIDSVTKAFYEAGWSGINIEPNEEFFHALEIERPRDRNFQVALSDEVGEGILNILEKSGLSTLDMNVVADHSENNLYVVEKKKVKIQTLNNILNSCCKKTDDIHFLKIDVEGLEAKVLSGNDWTIYRPWIIVIEATAPNTQKESYSEAEKILSKANYYFVYADGLNRFYISSEQEHLREKFKYPPNVFDNFTKSNTRILELLLNLSRESEKSLVGQVEDFEKKLTGILLSKSWRITAPLRRVMTAYSQIIKTIIKK